MTPTVDDVRDSLTRTAGYLRVTPVISATVPTPDGPREVAFKMENMQVSGSFKARGMLNAVLKASRAGHLLESGVVIASGGNAGIAAAAAARVVGCPVTVAVPGGSPATKVRRLRGLGAHVDDTSVDHRTSNEWADDFAAQTGAFRLHAYDLPDVVAGAGGCLLEAAEQAGPWDEVVVAVGGGGLVAGTCLVAEQSGTRVVAVEPTGAPTLHAALAAGRPVDVAVDSVAADSLGARRIGHLAWDICSPPRRRPHSVLVDDAAIVAAREMLWNEFRLLVEHAAACATAALMTGTHLTPRDSRVLVVLCGANTSCNL